MERAIYSTSFEAARAADKKSVVEKIDRFLRRNDTFLAEAARVLSGSKKGKEYLESPVKRILDLATSFPIAIVASPAILALGIAKKLEDGGSMLFVQKRRVSKGGREMRVLKIRSMREMAHEEGDIVARFSRGRNGWEDPRCTRLGAFLRKYDLDEFPQFLQVLAGELSLVGVRPCSDKTIDFLDQKWSKGRFDRWQLACAHTPMGITGTAQLFGSQRKESEKRFHFDVFYAENASLGLDIYLIARTAARMVKIAP